MPLLVPLRAYVGRARNGDWTYLLLTPDGWVR
jgi:hypothetical protein